jgi:hypothetical protein
MTPDTKVRNARELAAYEKCRAELERRYPGRIVLLHGDEVVGVFKDRIKAAKAAVDRFGVKQCWWQEIGKPVRLLPMWGAPDDEPPPPPLPRPNWEREEATYERLRAELERQYPVGQVALIRGDELIGVFPYMTDALDEGYRRFPGEKPYVREIGDPVYFYPYGVPPKQPENG